MSVKRRVQISRASSNGPIVLLDDVERLRSVTVSTTLAQLTVIALTWAALPSHGAKCSSFPFPSSDEMHWFHASDLNEQSIPSA